MLKLQKVIALIILAAALVTGVEAYAAPGRNWEPVKSERNDTKQVIKEQDIEIRTARGVIIVSTNRPVQIKVFTILGQLVSNETLGAGTSQLTIGSHGIYIVKTGGLTCKVAL